MLSANAASGNTNFHGRKKHSKTADATEKSACDETAEREKTPEKIGNPTHPSFAVIFKNPSLKEQRRRQTKNGAKEHCTMRFVRQNETAERP